MSSSYAIDSAWSHLENDDKIEKFVPLIPLALAGYGAYRGYQNVTNPGGPVVTDPLTGGMLYQRRVDPTFGGYASAFGSGALEGVGLGGLVKVGAKGVGKLAGRSAAKQAAARQAAAQQARKETTERLARQEADTVQRKLLAEGYGPNTVAALDDAALAGAKRSPYVMGQASGAARAAGAQGARREAATRGIQRGAGKIDDALSARALGLGGAGALALGAGGAFMANQAMNNATVDPDTSGFGGYGGASSGFGSGNYGMGAQGTGAGGFGMDTGIGGVSNQSSNLTDRRKIWTGEENTQQYGGQIVTGENMNIGERMLKQVQERMDKAHCDGAVKEEDKKNSKKPAHGMVIVIGSKAGPGPSKNGKREKLDSEKDKKDE
tara:strand:+ start:1336 stop:2472 length:1137 start_codon:yes stop_codon:yes gene_type:complete